VADTDGIARRVVYWVKLPHIPQAKPISRQIPSQSTQQMPGPLNRPPPLTYAPLIACLQEKMCLITSAIVRDIVQKRCPAAVPGNEEKHESKGAAAVTEDTATKEAGASGTAAAAGQAPSGSGQQQAGPASGSASEGQAPAAADVELQEADAEMEEEEVPEILAVEEPMEWPAEEL
jgi:hypothetical protein